MDYQRAIRLRASGQYNAALSSLSQLSDAVSSGEHEAVTRLMITFERAICHVLQNKFNDVYEDFRVVQDLQTEPECKEASFINLLYDYARFHTDLALQEAVQTAQDVYQKWIFDRNVQDFDPVDVHIICIHHVVEDLGHRMLDLPRSNDPPSWSRMEELRTWLLQQCRYDDLAMIHLAHAETRAASVRITRLRQTIDALGSDNRDMQVHLKILLAEALHENGEGWLALEMLAELRDTPLSDNNPERQLWGKYCTLRFNVTSDTSNLANVEDLLHQFKGLKNEGACQSCEFLIAELNLKGGFVDQYVQRMRNVLNKRSGNQSLALHNFANKQQP
jgi:hypothetical protein